MVFCYSNWNRLKHHLTHLLNGMETQCLRSELIGTTNETLKNPAMP